MLLSNYLVYFIIIQELVDGVGMNEFLWKGEGKSYNKLRWMKFVETFNSLCFQLGDR